jgi:hypothetical protein
MTLAVEAAPARTPDSAQPIGLCLDCGYSLFGLRRRAVPNADAGSIRWTRSTMNMGRELSELAKWVLGPLRWPVNLLSWGALFYALWEARLPGDQIARSSSLKLLIALGIFWLTWPIVRYVAAKKYGWPHSLLMRGQKLRIAVGLCLLAASWAIVRNFPLRAALYVSMPAMEKLADDTIRAPLPYQEDRRVGVFYARRVKQIPGGGMRFTVEESKRTYRSGFVYLPNTDPKRVGWQNRNYRYVGGHWWTWREEG